MSNRTYCQRFGRAIELAGQHGTLVVSRSKQWSLAFRLAETEKRRVIYCLKDDDWIITSQYHRFYEKRQNLANKRRNGWTHSEIQYRENCRNWISARRLMAWIYLLSELSVFTEATREPAGARSCCSPDAHRIARPCLNDIEHYISVYRSHRTITDVSAFRKCSVIQATILNFSLLCSITSDFIVHLAGTCLWYFFRATAGLIKLKSYMRLNN